MNEQQDMTDETTSKEADSKEADSKETSNPSAEKTGFQFYDAMQTAIELKSKVKRLEKGMQEQQALVDSCHSTINQAKHAISDYIRIVVENAYLEMGEIKYSTLAALAKWDKRGIFRYIKTTLADNAVDEKPNLWLSSFDEDSKDIHFQFGRNYEGFMYLPKEILKGHMRHAMDMVLSLLRESTERMMESLSAIKWGDGTPIDVNLPV